MDVTITGLPDDMTMQELATRCRLYRKYGYAAEVEPIEPEQSEKPLHTQAAEILGHIHNKDYGLAESKAGLLRDQLQKGDWTLGAGTETELPDDGFVRMRCDDIIDNVHISNTPLSVAQIKFLYGRTGESSDYGDHAALLRILEVVNRLNCSDVKKDVRAIKSMKSVERIITEWGAQRDEGTAQIKEGVCAFCGSDEPSIICEGKLFCDMKCANNYTNKDTLIKELRSTIYNLEVELKSTAKSLLDSSDSIYNRNSIIGGKVATIRLLKRRVGDQENILQNWQKEIEDLNTDNDVKDKMLEKYRREIVGLRDMHDVVWDKVHALEAEQSTREQDSEVLRQVVEVVKNYDDSKWQGYNTMHKIVDLLVDYIEVPEARAG